MLYEHERYNGLGMDAFVIVWSSNTNVIMVAAKCFRNRMLQEYERYYGFVMDALATVCSRDTNVIMAGAWILW